MQNQKKASPSQPEDAEGVVAFGSNVLDSYRYRLSLRNEKLNIWLENRKSKKQWETGELGMEAFVPVDGVIPRAGMSDYFTCFLNALECPPASDESQRNLQFKNTDHLSLEFVLKLKVFASVWTPTYTFELKPIPLEKVDILESKLRDQEEELIKLRAERCQAPAKPVYIQVTSTNTAYYDDAITWNVANNDSFKIDSNGAVEILIAGVYMIHVVLRHRNSSNAEAFCLMKGNVSVGSCYDTISNSSKFMLKGNKSVDSCYETCSSSNKFMSSPLMAILDLVGSEKLSVIYKGNDRAIEGSFLTAFLLR